MDARGLLFGSITLGVIMIGFSMYSPAPRQAAPPPRPAATSQQGTATTQLTDLAVIKDKFERQGCSVRWAASGISGVQAIAVQGSGWQARVLWYSNTADLDQRVSAARMELNTNDLKAPKKPLTMYASSPFLFTDITPNGPEVELPPLIAEVVPGGERL